MVNLRIKRIRFRPVLVSICLALFCSTGTVFAQVTDDHGNTPETATTIQLSTSLSGRIEPENDTDYFRIDITESTTIAIFTTGNLDAFGILQNSSGTNVMEDDDSGLEVNFLISASLEQGTYYIAVTSFNAASTGDYTLHVDAGDDHGNTSATATFLPLNTTVLGTIAPEGDIDYFEIDLTEITEPTLINLFTTGDLDTSGVLLDRNQNALVLPHETDTVGTSDNFLIQDNLERGIYYIVVDVARMQLGNYIFHVQTDDHRDTTPTSTTIDLNKAVSGTIEHGDDIDYFKIEITESTMVHLFTTGNLDTVGLLQNEAGSGLESADEEFVPDNPNNHNFLITRSLDSGIYYIEVSSFGSAVGDYVLHVRTGDYTVVLALIIPSALAESTNEVIGSAVIDVKHGEPFPVHINVTAFEATDTLTLTLDGPQNAALPTTLMTSALSAGGIWTDFYLGYGPSEGTGEASYRYCQSGTENCSSSILVSYSPPAAPVVDVDDRYGEAWDFTLSEAFAENGCSPASARTEAILVMQEGNVFNSGFFAGIVDGDSYSVGYHDPDFVGGSLIDTIVMQYSGEPDPVALSGSGVWWWTNRVGFSCRGTYNIRYTPRLDDLPEIRFIIPSEIVTLDNTAIGSTMIDVRHGEPFPVHINVTVFETADTLTLTLVGPQNAALPTTLTVPVLASGDTWSEFYLGYGPSDGIGEASYRYCQPGTENCSSSILVSYSPPNAPVVDVDEISSEWDFTVSNQFVTGVCSQHDPGTALFSQEGNDLTSTIRYTDTTYNGIGIVDDIFYSLAYRDPDFGGGSFIDTLRVYYSTNPDALSGTGDLWWTDRAGFSCHNAYDIRYIPRPRDPDESVPQISLIIPSTLAESTNEVIGSTMIDVKHGEPFPVYISVGTFETADTLTLTLDGPQNAALPTTLTVPVLASGDTWSEFYLGYGPSEGTGEASYRYCQSGTQNCSSSILVSYSPPAAPVVDVDDRYGAEWDFTVGDQTVTNGCSPFDSGPYQTLLSQEGNIFTSIAYTGIVDGDSYSFAYRDPDSAGGTYIDTLVTQYSVDPVALSGPGVWWWTDKVGFLCRGTYNIRYTPRPFIDSITVGRISVSEDIGNVTVTVTLTHPPIQPVVAMLEIEGTATTDADYDNVERNINFGIGEQQTTLNLVIVDDSLVELDETIILKVVSQDLDKLVGESSTTLTIVDNDVPAISFEQAEYTIDEGTTGTIILRADQLPVVETRVELTTLSATIEDGEYQLSATVVVFEAGQSTASFEVSISDDGDVQATRELSLSLAPLNNSATRGTTYETVISIRNNDVPAISFEQAEYTIDEDTAGTIILRADQLPVVETRVELTTLSATIEDGEYQLSTTVVVFEAGQSTASFEVSISDDDIVRSTRELSLSLAPLGGSATRGTPHETVISIGNNDVSEVTLAVVGNDILLVEGDITTLQITLARAFDQETSVRIVTAGTATTDDYTIAMNPVIFAAYETYAETTLRITADGDESERDESIILTLAANNDLIITDRPEAKLTLTIASNIPAISFEQEEYIIEEGTTGTITLIVSPLPALETRVELTTLLGTTVAYGGYRLSTTVIVFEAGQSTASFEVSISDEAGFSNPLRELHLSFALLDNNAIYRATSETVITVSEGQPMVSLPQTIARADEDAGSATLRIENDRLTAGPLTVNLLYTGDPGALTGTFSSVDISDVSTTVTIDTHLRTKHTFTVDIEDDEIAAEFTRTVNIMLQPGDGYIVSGTDDTVALAVQESDFARASFSQSTGTVTEGEAIELTVIKDLASDGPTEVNVFFTYMGNFFESQPIATTRVSFPAEVAMSRQTIIIPTVNDLAVEPDGFLRAQIEAVPGSTVNAGTMDVTTVTVLDNDVPAAISFEQAEYIIDEGTTGTITLTASPLPLVETRVELTTLMGTTVGKYRLSTTVIVFEAGQSTASFEVSISDEDGFSNPLRELRLSFAPLDNNAMHGATSETVITVSEGPPMVWFRSPSILVTEGDGFATVRIETDRLTAEPLTVNLLYTGEGVNRFGNALTGVSALTGELSSVPDVSTRVTINTDIRTTQTFDVEVVDDRRAAEFRQFLHIVLQDGDGYVVGATDRSEGRYDTLELGVQDDDFAEVFFSQAGGTVTEGEPIELIVRRDLETAIVTRVSIEFTTTGNFFESVSIPTRQLSFPAGVAMSTQKIVIPTVNDLNVEADGTLLAEIMIIPGSPLRPGTPDMRTVTILDNDVPAISFEQAEYTIVEGTTGTIILEADQIPVREARIELTTVMGTTVADGEYQLSTTIVVFEPGQTTASFEVSISDDIDDEVDVITRSLGKLSLSIAPLNNSAIRGTTPDTVINAENNDTSSVTLTVAGDVTTLEERDSASATLQITLTRAFDEDTNITIVTAGAAMPNIDYNIAMNPVVLLANTTYTEIVLTVIDDNLVEEGETIILTLAAENPLVRGDGPEGTQLTLTIEDNDVPPISFEQAEYTIAEGTTGTIILRADQTPLVAAQIELTADSAMVENDEYQLSTTIVVFEPGQTTASFEVSIFDDDIVQSTRELSLSISSLNNSAIRGTTPDTVINVENNDTSSVTLTVAGGVTTLMEGDSASATLQITLTHAFDQETSITIVIDSGGTATRDTDYRINTDPLVLPAYSTYTEIVLTVIDDNLVEEGETIILTLAANNDLITTDSSEARLTLTIEDNDVSPISFEQAEYTIAEGTTGTIILRADQTPLVAAQIELTADSAMVENSEYQLSTTIVVFEPGQTTASFEVSIFDDDIVQSTRELSLSISSMNNSAIRGTPHETVISIEDNDTSSVTLTVVGGVTTLMEGDSASATLQITLTHAFDEETTISIVIAGVAMPNIDYTIAMNPVVLLANTTFTEIVLTVTDDNLVEENETIILTLAANNNLIIDNDEQLILTIEDNDVPPISFEQAEYTITEGTTGTIILRAEQTPLVAAQIELTADSAMVENDEYQLFTTIVVFEPGQTTASFTVSILDDDVIGSGRELSLSISPLNNSAIRGTTPDTVISIEDNDTSSVTLTVVGGVTTLEEGKDVTLQITLDRPLDQDTNITILTAGTATPDTDYTISPNPVVLRANSFSAETTLSITMNAEPDETIILTLEADNPLVIGDGPEGTKVMLTIGKATLLFRIKVFLEGAQ